MTPEPPASGNLRDVLCTLRILLAGFSLFATPHYRKEHMTKAALEALIRIRNLNKYPCPQTPHAIQKILKALHVADYMAVVQALENPVPTPDPQTLTRAITFLREFVKGPTVANELYLSAKIEGFDRAVIHRALHEVGYTLIDVEHADGEIVKYAVTFEQALNAAKNGGAQ